MIHYILQMLAFQLLFLLVYDLFLKKETFFNWNRVYLILTHILSYILPFIKIGLIQQRIPQEYHISLPTLLIGGSGTREITLPEVIIGMNASLSEYLTLSKILEYVWYLGLIISLCIFSYKLHKIICLKRTGIRTRMEKINLISLPGANTAFSFFNTIFIGSKLSEVKKASILIHEKVHVKEYHSLDLLFFETLRILCWFNPLVYIYQNRITTLQEYIADAKAITETDKKEYYQDLLSQIFQTDKISFVNTFFNHSLIKNRIVMLQKSKSRKIFQLKYLLLVPVVCTMLLYTSCTVDSNVQQEQTLTKEEVLQELKKLMEQTKGIEELTEEQKNDIQILMKQLKTVYKPDAGFGKMHKTDGIPFNHIEKIPVYPGCSETSREETKKCFSQNIAQFVGSEFNTKIGEELNLTGKQKIYVRFKIDMTGKIVDIKARGPLPELETEAVRVIEKLPQMTPGMQDGVTVGVMYSLPIVFDIKG